MIQYKTFWKFAAISFIFLSTFISAETKVNKLVVAKFDIFLIENQNGSLISDLIESELSSKKNIALIERRKLDEVLKETALGQSGIINSNDASEIGKISGADYIIIGSAGKLGQEYVINIRVVHVMSGKILKGFSLSSLAPDAYHEMTGEISELIVKIIEGKDVPVSQKFSGNYQKIKIKNKEDFSGYWNTEWYNNNGKNTGSMYLTQNGNKISGWTVESIGPARIDGTFTGGNFTGKYTASYGAGEFEFTLSNDGKRLMGSYTTGQGFHNIWNAWKTIPDNPDVKKGARVFADWEKDIWSYPGVIDDINDERYLIKYDDGETEWVLREKIFKYELNPGEVIYILNDATKKYIYATVIQFNPSGNVVEVEFADGKKKKEPASKIRVLRIRKNGY